MTSHVITPDKNTFADSAASSKPTSASSFKLSDLYDDTRFPSHWKWGRLLLIPYLPFGLVLVLFRMLGSVVLNLHQRLAPSLNATSRRRSFCSWLYQFRFVHKNAELLGQASEPLVIVSNHLCLWDGPALSQKFGATILSSNASNVSHAILFSLFDSHVLGTSVAARRTVRADLQNAFKDKKFSRLLVFPEGVIGNGQGLHVFQKLVFSIDVPVAPICLKIKTPFPLHLHPLNHAHILNILWLWFMPWVTFEYTSLPKMTREPDESAADFAERVRQSMARAMNVPTTPFSGRDKQQLKQKDTAHEATPALQAGGFRALELKGLQWLQRTCSSKWLDHVMKSAGILGKPYVYALGILALSFFSASHAWQMLLLLLTAEVVQHVLKKTFKSPRPTAYGNMVQAKVHEHGNGLPSAHVQNATAISGAAAILLGGASISAMAIAGLWVLITAYSRLYLGAHFFRDVLAGLLSGLLLLLGFVLLSALG